MTYLVELFVCGPAYLLTELVARAERSGTMSMLWVQETVS